MTACILVVVYILIDEIFDAVMSIKFFVLVPVSFVAVFGWKLVSFTEEYRDFLYAIETITGADIDADGMVGRPFPEAPPPKPNGTYLRGADGSMRKISVTLSPSEVRELKWHLLNEGKLGTAKLLELWGEESTAESRPSKLRLELFNIGIVTLPKRKSSPALTDEGRIAVQQW